MIQSDALSQRPDHFPEKDENDVPTTLLEEKLFINLIGSNLQRRIDEAEGTDQNALEALKILVENGMPGNKKALEDWTIINEKGRKLTLFYKISNIFLKTPKSDGK